VEILTSPLLAALPWLSHGFGTKLAPLSQEGMVSLKQIHSDRPLLAEQTTGCAGEGDALLTCRPGIAISIRTADCYPILLADPESHAVAAIHAGWRGTDAHIVEKTLSRMHREFGSEPGRMVAAIGPGIGGCCYEVGIEVARRFGFDKPGRLDLAAENLKQLLSADVARERIDLLGGCTQCDRRFHSWRRDGENAGRMISFIRSDQ
jgi:hypothetical protein